MKTGGRGKKEHKGRGCGIYSQQGDRWRVCLGSQSVDTEVRVVELSAQDFTITF